MKLIKLLSILALVAVAVGCAKPKNETPDMGPVVTEQQMTDDFKSIGASRDTLASVGLKVDTDHLPLKFDEKYAEAFRKKNPRIKLAKLRNDQIIALQAHSLLLSAHVNKYDRHFQLVRSNGNLEYKAGFIPGLKDFFMEEKSLIDAKLAEISGQPAPVEEQQTPKPPRRGRRH